MKKRILSFLMCIALLLASVVILASCKDKDKDKDNEGDGNFKVSDEIVELDLTGCTIVTGSDLTDDGKKHVLNFGREISRLTTVNLGVINEVVTEEDTEIIKTNDFEILIGTTSRKESIETLNAIKDAGWTVQVLENKIVIVGTTPYLTRVALSWFEQTYLNAEHVNGTALSLNRKASVSKIPTFSVVPSADPAGDSASNVLAVVYGKRVLINGANDAPKQMATQVSESLTQRTGAKVMCITSDSEEQEKEILVGYMNRPDVQEEMAKIEADQYAVTIKNGKIYIVAWEDEVLRSAYDLFQDMLAGSSFEDDDGNTYYEIPNNCTVVQNYASNWVTDFPKPVAEKLYPEVAVDVNDGALQYIYSGEGATRETFVAYCETLKAAGFTPMGNEDVQWEGSSFRTFLHEEKGVSLHVSHMAFTHAVEQKTNAPFFNSIRIVSGSIETGGAIPDAKYFRPQIAGTEEEVASGAADYVKRINSRISCNMIDYETESNWGLGQIITLADGSFIIIDGGRAKGTAEVDNVWYLLRNLHKEAYGSYPTKEQPVHIRAWVITHEHGDHHNVIRSFCNRFGFKPELQFDYLLVNFGKKETQLKVGGGTFSLRNQMKTLRSAVKRGFEYIQVNSGQVFYFANCRLEVLATLDDIYPWTPNEANNANTITRTALYETDGVNSYETTCLWLGDAENQMSRVARAMYGPFLQSEQVQIAHHGFYGGSEKQLYELVGNCKVVWYPGVTSQTAVNRCLADWSYSPAVKNPDCRLLIFNGAYGDRAASSSNSLVSYRKYEVTLIIKPTGIAYDELYDAATGEKITPKGEVGTVVDVPAYRKAVGK